MVLDEATTAVFLINLESQRVFPLARLPDEAQGAGESRKGLTGARGSAERRCAKANDGTNVLLPSIRVGGTACTSLEAFHWFCGRLSMKSTSSPTVNKEPASPRRDQESGRTPSGRLEYPVTRP